jgi:glutaredoxin
MNITIYGKANCAGCDQAKNLMEAKGQEYKYVDITQNPEAMQMFRTRGFRAVPQIFNGEAHVGGVAELQTLVG